MSYNAVCAFIQKKEASKKNSPVGTRLTEAKTEQEHEERPKERSEVYHATQEGRLEH